jgi:hypothetical protein
MSETAEHTGQRGGYAPSLTRTRDQVALYESTAGAQGGAFGGRGCTPARCSGPRRSDGG